MDADTSQREAPTFTAIDRSIKQTMLDLTWDHKVNLIGKKVVNPMMHNCDQCKKPVLIYGRMIPCKHVYCLSCATQSLAPSTTSTCPRCSDKVERVEEAGPGSIYMCAYGGSRHGNNGCRKTYLSQRDLQAHVEYRHIKHQSGYAGSTSATVSQSQAVQQNAYNNPTSLLRISASQLPSAQLTVASTTAIVVKRERNEYQQYPAQKTAISPVTAIPHQHSHGPTSGYQQFQHPPPHQGSISSTYPYVSPGQVNHQQSNLITVPIQDNTTSVPGGNITTADNYNASLQSIPWTQQTANTTGIYPPIASTYYHTSSNNIGNNSTPSAIGGYIANNGLTSTHSQHSSHYREPHLQVSAAGQMMRNTAQWNLHSNSRKMGVDRSTNAANHVRRSGDRTSGGYAR